MTKTHGRTDPARYPRPSGRIADLIPRRGEPPALLTETEVRALMGAGQRRAVTLRKQGMWPPHIPCPPKARRLYHRTVVETFLRELAEHGAQRAVAAAQRFAGG